MVWVARAALVVPAVSVLKVEKAALVHLVAPGVSVAQVAKAPQEWVSVVPAA